MPLEAGLTATATLVVSDDDTAIAFRSGTVPVLATPRLLALCEEATLTAIDKGLDEGTTSVGMRLNLDHVRPTAVGGQVTAIASLERVEGRRLTFAVHAMHANGDVIAVGRVIRVLVETDRFLDKLG